MRDDRTIMQWFKSSYSNDGSNCVEASTNLLDEGQVPVRDSKDITRKHLTFSTEAFGVFIGTVKKDTFGI